MLRKNDAGVPCMHLLWVPVLVFKERSNHNNVRVLARAARMPSTHNQLYHMPFMMINTLDHDYAFRSGIHEAFHTVRHPLFYPIDRSTGSGAEKFDHLGYMMKKPIGLWMIDFIEPSWKYCWQMLRISRMLTRFFGENAWYVLTRLTYEELYPVLLKGGKNPIEYLRYMADSKNYGLRHRIICTKLGL